MNFLEKALAFIFPPVCGICGKTGKTYICEKCITKIKQEKIYKPTIEKYVNNFQSNVVQLNKNNILEKNKENIENIIQKNDDIQNFYVEHCYLFYYDGIIRKKILQYKFSNKAYLANMFFEFFVKNEKICGFLKKYDIIMEVPISKKKMSERGYNQSSLIASKISKYTGIVHEKHILIKCKENEVQSTLNKKQRLENVKNVYKVQNEQKIKGKNIVLFDDIFTTGATRK